MRRWQLIVVVAIAAALLVVFNRAGADEPPGCDDVGRVAEVRDPRGDTSGPDGIDLTSVRLARSASTLCVEFEAAADIPAATSFSLVLGRDVAVSATVLFGGTRQVSLHYPGVEERDDAGLVDGGIDVEGDRLILQVERSLLPRVEGGAWEGRSLAIGDGPDERHTDCAPDCR